MKITSNHLSTLQVLSLICSSSAFTAPQTPAVQRIHSSSLQAHGNKNTPSINILTASATALAILTLPITTPLSNIANADEWGRETEAPTLFTGETTMICKKRGPLGACLETTIRTASNDNDKSLGYFRDPSDEVKRKQAKMIADAEDEGNELIMKLRRQSEENREKNENEVRVKTMMNDAVGLLLFSCLEFSYVNFHLSRADNFANHDILLRRVPASDHLTHR
jgi:hypothetical protein